MAVGGLQHAAVPPDRPDRCIRAIDGEVLGGAAPNVRGDRRTASAAARHRRKAARPGTARTETPGRTANPRHGRRCTTLIERAGRTSARPTLRAVETRLVEASLDFEDFLDPSTRSSAGR